MSKVSTLCGVIIHALEQIEECQRDAKDVFGPISKEIETTAKVLKALQGSLSHPSWGVAEEVDELRLALRTLDLSDLNIALVRLDNRMEAVLAKEAKEIAAVRRAEREAERAASVA
jgi:Asp-tRNA(Asn)/Glu-tRNA(Gln) amidotransferase A subunit family amidase